MFVKELDSVFAEMNAATNEAVWEGIPELTPREKILLLLTADICQQTLGRPFEEHVLAGLDNGLTADDLRELLRFIAYDSGYPAAASALARLVEIEREHGLTPTGQSHEIDAHGASSPIPAPVRQAVRALDPGFGDYMDLQSRMRAGMRLLTVRERAFATITVDVLYQTLAESFEVHVGRALRAGATADEVKAVVRFSAQFGMTKAWRGMRVLNGLLTGSGSVLA
jgi:alkylhydroperoxidase/carboxymuconolactone decarboxylase family protein YurZ